MIRTKDITSMPPKPAGRDKKRITAQQQGDILILNCYGDRILIGRYCLDIGTNRFRSWTAKEGKWTEQKLLTVFGYNPLYETYYWLADTIKFDTEEDERLVRKMLPDARKNLLCAVGEREEEYAREQRERKENNRIHRLNELMAKVPPMPKDIREWIHEKTGGDDYMMKKTGEKRWICTNCRSEWTEKELQKADGTAGINENDILICRKCKKAVRIKKRKRTIRIQTQCMLLQNLDEKQSVARHIDTAITWTNEGRTIKMSEGVRLILYRDHPRYACGIYYSQYAKSSWGYRENCFDMHNPENRRIGSGYLYPEGIADAIRGTKYAPWEHVFVKAAEEGLYLDYNRAMAVSLDKGFVRMCEYLLKGRFRRLLSESIEQIFIYSAEYKGPLDKTGMSIEEVFRIADRQKINRIRERDGGGLMLEWMRMSEETGHRVSQAFLDWAEKNCLHPQKVRTAAERMSPEQIMNYVRRQAEESYSGKTDMEVINQWQDYLNMCSMLGKNLDDEMVYRPRELKRRHDAAVEERRKQQMLEEMQRNKERAEQMAEEMRRKFPGAEENLEEIRDRFEYGNGEYRIIVPRHLSEISAEGYALHHCAGASERYFERIMRHETYICFLRRQQEPDVPFYTIEVEPGGTIRQHRSMYDEEPGIKEIRGFLKEWQKVIRSRMKEEDHKRAGISRKLREDNIRQLQEANNTRVLQGLMEDFMEAETDAETETENSMAG